MNDSLPITTSTSKKPSKRLMKKEHLDDARLSSTTGRCDTSPLFVKQGNKLEVILLCNSKSVFSQSMMATTDTPSSVVSAEESTISSSVVNSEPAQKSALKREHAPRRNRSLQQQVRIQFSPAIQQQPHIALHEFTAEELETCWLRREEYAQIYRSCYKEINLLEQEQGHPRHATLRNHDRKHCFRGLERHTRQGAIVKTQNRRVAWDAVLNEQCDQVSLGVIDQGAIASRYHDASRSCRLWAIRIAQQDQRAAELVYDAMLD